MQKNPEYPEQNLKQMWFPGEHGCVGGGSEENCGLSDGALLWMIEESQKLGIEFDVTKVITGINPDPKAHFDNTTKGIFKATQTHLRRVDENPANLHQSVTERWSALGEYYRPKNLAVHIVYLDDMSNNLSNIAKADSSLLQTGV